jgi:hypothetical protein
LIRTCRRTGQADLLRTAYELGGVEAEVETTPLHPAAQALTGIGLSAGDFDPDRDVPPFYDELTQTAYWIGIYQPDPDDRATCVASILSLTRDPDSGAYEAQLAPCVAGDWDKAYQSSEHLIVSPSAQTISSGCLRLPRVWRLPPISARSGCMNAAWRWSRSRPR